MAFCAIQIDDKLYVGCNKGFLFIYDAARGYEAMTPVTLKDRITCMQVVTLENGDKHLICCQFTGHVNILSVSGKGGAEPVGYEQHNTLSNIFRIEYIPTDKANTLKFALATNNGVIVLQIDTKKQLKQSLTGEKYCEGKVVNNIVVMSNHLIAFVHDAEGYFIINRDKRAEEIMKWPMEKKSVVIGAAATPDFHRDENSFIFVRDESTIKLINTQDWKVCDLVTIGEGLKFPDLKLFEVMKENGNQISIFTTKGDNNNQLIKRTYSHLLKYCMQTASIKSSAQIGDPERGNATINNATRANTMLLGRQATHVGKHLN